MCGYWVVYSVLLFYAEDLWMARDTVVEAQLLYNLLVKLHEGNLAMLIAMGLVVVVWVYQVVRRVTSMLRTRSGMSCSSIDEDTPHD